MSFKPEISELNLDACCKKTIETIKYQIAAGNWLQKIALPATFAGLLVGPPKGAAVFAAASVRNVSASNWETVIEAVKVIPDTTRRLVRTQCFRESLKHTGKLGQFWKGLYHAFS